MRTFDTLLYTKRALEAGHTKKQAEFHAEEMATLVEQTLVSRSVLKHELFAMNAKIQAAQFKMAWWTVFGLTTSLSAIQIFFHILDHV